MWPISAELSAQAVGSNEGALEDRLRGLILSNANANTVPSSQPQALPLPPKLPPHLTAATPEEQEDYFAKQAPQGSASSLGQGPPSPSKTFSNDKNPGARKKLNQAQRRKLNSELSIPIDGRTNPSFAHSGRAGGFSTSPRGPSGFNNHHQNQMHQSPRYPNYSPHFPYSPHSQGPSPASPYLTNMHLQQGPPHPSMQQYQPNTPGHMYGMQSPNQYQQWSGGHSPGPGSFTPRAPPQNRQLYHPGTPGLHGRGRPFQSPIGMTSEDIQSQGAYLESLCQIHASSAGVEDDEIAQKEVFRALVEKSCREAIVEYEQQELGNTSFDPLGVELKCFGSMSSGFATKASDMDLALLSPQSSPAPDAAESPIPRLLEKKLLSMGFGARLLTRTRVPIIKLCEKPTEKLLADLLEARTKWENGFHEDDDDDLHQGEAVDDDKAVTEQASKSASDIMPKEDANVTSPKTKPDTVKSASTVERTTEKKVDKVDGDFESSMDPLQAKCDFTKMKQKQNQSMGDYYNLAKRLLRRANGRDISPSSPVLTEQEMVTLNEACKALIDGLHSQDLSNRLREYKTIAPLFNPSLPFLQRSLQGVWAQIEGERLAMVWESRPLSECLERHEVEAAEIVKEWRELQDKEGLLTEPMAYNRVLYLGSEKLKKIASLRLVYFEQLHYEEPQYYEARAQRMIDELGRSSGADPHRLSTVAAIVIAHYINGIMNTQIREELQKPSRTRTTLKQVALQHSSLQLAADYEHALSTSVFHEDDQQDVKDYISILRDPTILELKETRAVAPLVSRIRRLPDPTQKSLNKPRDRYNDHLEFPKTDIGIQCDINFSAHLALQNTLLLRCYSHSDFRVKIMVLFIKHWAKVRGINTPYRGSLSSYGYVLMVLHYLVNVANPAVCPNLQLPRQDPIAAISSRTLVADQRTCEGRDVTFWRDEAEIKSAADKKILTNNNDNIGTLLRGFFEYFAQSGQMTTVQDRGFDWGREVLSLRTPHGILTKQEKGWVGARTVIETTATAAPPTPSTPAARPMEIMQDLSSGATLDLSPVTDSKPKGTLKTVEETKEIRHRYLFAIEDPFELDHNVARTVTHNGIVQIRDEFRRAWRIIRNVGKGSKQEGLLDPLDLEAMANESKSRWMHLLDVIHGPEQKLEGDSFPTPSA
ncbi:hypothetical protein BP6252_05251 [Coleophoma cylindrospora]|uniref:polynucleotide adenylyltransferase n=1 Tax=Coleophoma cylindrospora TaxID=1849047 RepID=A0A3D8RTA5_9HELO|nr:hypothetical protein BP6252_05251 [Coleophoma cylindrospora]